MRKGDKLNNYEVIKFFGNLKNTDNKPTIDSIVERYHHDLLFVQPPSKADSNDISSSIKSVHSSDLPTERSSW